MRRTFPGLLLLGGLVLTGPCMADSTADIIKDAARTFGINPQLFGCLVQRESKANPFALNIGGRSYFPADTQSAQAVLDTLPRHLLHRLRFPWRVQKRSGAIMRFRTEHEAQQHATGGGPVVWDGANIDVGLTQINWYWHGRRFDRIEDLFDARLNAYYGAHYLRGLIDRFGLSAGIGRYHSQKTPERRERYRGFLHDCLAASGGIQHALD